MQVNYLDILEEHFEENSFEDFQKYSKVAYKSGYTEPTAIEEEYSEQQFSKFYQNPQPRKEKPILKKKPILKEKPRLIEQSPIKQQPKTIQGTLNSLSGQELMQIYVNKQFFGQILAYKEDYPRDVDKLLWRLTFMLGQVIMEIQNTLIHLNFLEQCTILTIKEIKQAAYLLLQQELNSWNCSREENEEFQKIKVVINEVFSKGYCDEASAKIVYVFVLAIWKKPIQFTLDATKQEKRNNQFQDKDVQTDEIKPSFANPSIFRQKLSKLNFPETFKHQRDTNRKQFQVSQVSLFPHSNQEKARNLLNNSNYFPTSRKAIDVNYGNFAHSTVDQIEPPIPIVKKKKEKMVKQAKPQQEVPKKKKGRPRKNPDPNLPIRPYNPRSPINKPYQPPPSNKNTNFQFIEYVQPSVKMQTFDNHDQSRVQNLDENQFPPVKQENRKAENIFARETYPESNARESVVVNSQNEQNGQVEGRNNKGQTFKDRMREKWTPQQQNLLVLTYIQSGNESKCSQVLSQRYDPHPKWSLPGIKLRINWIIHKVHKRFSQLQTKNESINKFKSNWNFITSKTSPATRTNIYIIILEIYTAMLNMSEEKKEVVSKNISQINRICANARRDGQK